MSESSSAREGRDFSSIPGTLVYDGHLARSGHGLNKMCRSLIQEAARDEFKRDPAAYMGRFRMSDEQRAAVLDRDWKALLRLGGNVYYLAKLGGVLGASVHDLGAAMSDMTLEEYQQMLANGGRKADG